MNDEKEIEKLEKMANVLRRDSLKATTAAGSGHATSSLSCADVISVLFFSEMSYDIGNPFNPDNDEFILSKGHASPVLYSALFRAGCIREDLTSLRKLKSNLEGHPMPRSLPWVKVATGSLGQGLSVGVGMALASKLQGRKFRVYVLLGDGEIAEGSVYEAIELGAHYNLKNLIAIVDVNRLGQTGETMSGHRMKEHEKRLEGFGWNVLSINGHDVNEIKKSLSSARKSLKPTIILAKTFKGKGVSFLENKEGWHGKAVPEDRLEEALSEMPENDMPEFRIKKPVALKRKFRHGKFRPNNYGIGDEIATRQAYGNALSNLAKSDGRIMAVDAEVSNSTKSEEVRKTSAGQFMEAYVAEQNMVGMAMGLEKKGYNVFASSFAAFLSRASDQIRMAAISGVKNLTFCGSHSGISIGQDGASQMGLEDIGLFRSLPDSFVFCPCDAVSSEKLTLLASETPGLKYIRTTRPDTKVIYKNSEKFRIGDFKILKQSNRDKSVIAGSGITVHEALKAHEELRKKGKNAAIIDVWCVKPFNRKKLIQLIKKSGNRLIVVEDHYAEGGIGEMLAAKLINEKINFSHLCVRGIPHSGKKEELMSKHGIDYKSIIREFEK